MANETGTIAVDIRDLSMRIDDDTPLILDGINLSINAGEFVVICGPSGSGKSTLATCINGITPHFSEVSLTGSVNVEGVVVAEASVHELAEKVASVFQDPSSGVFSLTVENEIAFGPENLGRDKATIIRDVEDTIANTNLESIRRSATTSLSGGQLQRVAIAGALAMHTPVLLLDEPTTDLDPEGKREVCDQIQELHERYGCTTIVIEHDLDHLVQFADRVIVLAEGQIVIDGPPSIVLGEQIKQVLDLGIRVPQFMKLFQLFRGRGYAAGHPLNVREAISQLESLAPHLKWAPPPPVEAPKTTDSQDDERKTPTLSFNGVTSGYSRNPILRDIDLDIYPGEIVAVLGHNGAGKSTLARTAIGLIDPTSGAVTLAGRPVDKLKSHDIVELIGFSFQNPDVQLFCNSVRDELNFGFKQRGERGDHDSIIQETLTMVGLESSMDRHPQAHSRGQRKRLAVATALVHHPKLVILDEPTTGQDGKNVEGMLELMKTLGAASGTATLMITHDIDLALNYASRVIIMEQGRIVLDCQPEEFYACVQSGPISKVQAPSMATILQCINVEGTHLRTLEEVDSRLLDSRSSHHHITKCANGASIV